MVLLFFSSNPKVATHNCNLNHYIITNKYLTKNIHFRTVSVHISVSHAMEIGIVPVDVRSYCNVM